LFHPERGKRVSRESVSAIALFQRFKIV
jgi:hypothetical protein